MSTAPATKRPVSRKATPTAKPAEMTPHKPLPANATPEQVAGKPAKEPKEPRETPAEKEAREAARIVALGLTGQYQDAFPLATRKAIVNSIREQIADAPIVNKKQAGCVQWTVSLALSLLRLMRGKGVQRPNFSWSQINDLASAMRAAVHGESHETQWYDGTNVAVISADDYGIDSRHRNMAFVVAFGTPLEIDEMLRIVHNHGEQPTDDQGNVNIDPADLLTLPITGWKPNDGENIKIEVPAWAFIVSLNVEREAFSVIDTAQRERTGADMLATYPESSRVLAETGIDAKTMETALGETYMRSNFTFVTTKDALGKEVTSTKMGSLKSGGKKGPNRYPVYSRLFGGAVEGDVYTPGLIARAHAIIEKVCQEQQLACTTTTGQSFTKSRLQAIGYYHVLSVAALAVDAWDDADQTIETFVKGLCLDIANADGKMPPAKTGVPTLHLKKYLEKKEYAGKESSKLFITSDGSKVVLKTAELYTAIVLGFTHPDTQFAQKQFIEKVAKEYDIDARIAGELEDGSTFGIDAVGLDKDLVTAAEKAIYGKATQVRANKKKK